MSLAGQGLSHYTNSASGIQPTPSAASLDLKPLRDTLHGAFSRTGFCVLTQDHSLGAAPGDVRRLLTTTIYNADCVLHLAGLANHAFAPVSGSPIVINAPVRARYLRTLFPAASGVAIPTLLEWILNP